MVVGSAHTCEHPRVQALYESWGFRKGGRQRLFADVPVFAVLPAGLPLGRIA
ncbi:hypothetical protein ACWCWD_18155 [Streptomyces sp. NPDC001493]